MSNHHFGFDRESMGETKIQVIPFKGDSRPGLEDW